MDQTSCRGIYPTPHRTSQKLSEGAPLQESILCPIGVQVHIFTPVRCTLTEECGAMTEVLNLKMSCPCEGEKDGTEEKDVPYKKVNTGCSASSRPITHNKLCKSCQNPDSRLGAHPQL